MKALKSVFVISILGFFFVSENLNAQRVVVRTPRTNVITTPRVVYTRPVPTVRVVRTIPARAVVMNYGGLRYHYFGGLFYRYLNGSYIVVNPPVGITVESLPEGYKQVVVGTDIYFYSSGNFYVQEDRQYKIVEPPLNAIVYDLPNEAEKVKIDGETYYQYNETLYQKVKTVGGKGYKVVGGIEA
ncbi:MAG: DUF6515 family protein [Bacteroidota bacterium]